jgi:hypothetical protein
MAWRPARRRRTGACRARPSREPLSTSCGRQRRDSERLGESSGRGTKTRDHPSHIITPHGADSESPIMMAGRQPEGFGGDRVSLAAPWAASPGPGSAIDCQHQLGGMPVIHCTGVRQQLFCQWPPASSAAPRQRPCCRGAVTLWPWTEADHWPGTVISSSSSSNTQAGELLVP